MGDKEKALSHPGERAGETRDLPNGYQSYRSRPYQYAPLNPNGVYWL
jgi:hypothetical protein